MFWVASPPLPSITPVVGCDVLVRVEEEKTDMATLIRGEFDIS
jgi:hypothetical protein